MNGIRALLFVAALSLLHVASGAEFHLYFDALTKDRYILVILRDNGKAAILHHETRRDGTVWLLHEEDCTWGYFPNQPKTARPNIWMATKQFHFDYFIEDERLTEIDKMGVQNVFTRRTNSTPTAK